VDRLTRKELKTDHFVEDVQVALEYMSEHRTQFLRYGAMALVVAVAAVGFYFYRKNAQTQRAQALITIREVESYPVSPTGQGDPGTRVFRSEEEKSAYLVKAYTEFVNKYPGTGEACMAEYSIGNSESGNGNYAKAQSYLEKATSCGDKDVASLAKLTLGQVYFAVDKPGEGEKLLRELIASPTPLVSQGQATITLARMLALSKPNEAKKLLEPLRTSGDSLGRAAMMLLSELQQSN
jgi:hypothetical protein